ncbi:MAG: phosphoribosylglycinamide formyltransferase [Clostridia bacterium]
MKKLAVFVSGGGSNFQALIDGIDEGKINGKITLCISSQPDAYALKRAAKHNIPAHIFSLSDHNSAEEMFAKIRILLLQNEIDLIILVGYMTILPPAFVRAFAGKIINIHPALLPKHSGKGYYGIRPHEAVIASGEKVSGATVHFVDEGVDTGEVILQEEVPVLPSDSPKDLQQRVLSLEHILICKAVALLCEKHT